MKTLKEVEKAMETSDSYTRIMEENLSDAVHELYKKGFELVSLFGMENFKCPGFTLLYVFEKKSLAGLCIFCCTPKKQVDSIACLYPSAAWYEREITDMFGFTFRGSFDTRSLILHETYPADFHPLLKTQQPTAKEERKDYIFRHISGEGVYEVPVGPVHAGIIEPGHFRFSVIGERVYSLEVRLFYKHRGIERLAEGMTPTECIRVAESISGDESFSNGFAFCSCIEKISGIKIPERADYLRAAYLELERVCSHLGDLAGMATDIGYPVGSSPFLILREEVMRLNQKLTGSRFLKDSLAIGGLKKDFPEMIESAIHFFESFKPAFKDAYAPLLESPSAIDRFEKTGTIEKRLIKPLHLTGPAARASGSSRDTRTDHPYGIYPRMISPTVKTRSSGDVLARFEVKAEEILESVRMILILLQELPAGEIITESRIKDGFSAVLVEAPRGQNMHWVSLKDGKITRYKIRTASYCNWQAIEHAVIGEILPDFPLINKSLNLSYAGTDL